MIKNRDIIVIGLQPWDIEIGSNCKDITRQFARHNRVLYVNSPVDRMTIWKHRIDAKVQQRLDIIRGKSDDLVQREENLWVFNPRTVLESISRLPWNGLFDRINRINNRRFARQIRSAAERLKFRDFILFNDGNMFRGFYLKELMNPDLYVYYSRDNFMAMDFWKVQGTRIEPALMGKADLVVANSSYLANAARKYNPNAFDVGSGCDLTLYDKKKIFSAPADIASIPGPVIGYTGALITLRLDPDILRYIASRNPEWSIVLIGPEDDDFRSSDLHGMKNVHFLGTKKPEELPAYISCFDVAINPQKVNEVTIGNYPRKIDEYLALGKPVVATKTETMSVFSGYAFLASGKEEFAAMIAQALRENSSEKELEREKFARSHSWENSVAGMYRFINERLNELHPLNNERNKKGS
jgi:glycosyltransferase involved in cell wall biosynthesis